MENFTGSFQESDLMHDLRRTADANLQHLNLSQSDFIVFSPVYVYLEQLEEIVASLISMFLLNSEYIMLIGFFLVFDVKAVLVLLAISASLLAAILANFVLLGLSLNIVTLNHFLLLPAFICEFLLYTTYSLRSDPTSGSADSNGNEMRLLIKGLKLDSECESNKSTENGGKDDASASGELWVCADKLRQIFDSNLTCGFNYLICVVGFSFSFMSMCSTYNFHTLFVFLMTFSVNTYVHLFLFYPVLSVLFLEL